MGSALPALTLSSIHWLANGEGSMGRVSREKKRTHGDISMASSALAAPNVGGLWLLEQVTDLERLA